MAKQFSTRRQYIRTMVFWLLSLPISATILAQSAGISAELYEPDFRRDEVGMVIFDPYKGVVQIDFLIPGYRLYPGFSSGDSIQDALNRAQVSVNATHEWMPSEHFRFVAWDLDTDSYRYRSTFHLHSPLDLPENVLHVYLRFPTRNPHGEDLVFAEFEKEFRIRYTKPLIELVSVLNGSPIPVSGNGSQGYLVLEPGSLHVNLMAFRSSHATDTLSMLHAIEGKKAGGDWHRLHVEARAQAELHTGYINILEAMGLGPLSPGMNRFGFRAIGRCATACLEVSEEITLEVFFLGMDLQLQNVFLQDTLYLLTASPPGGYFEGPGVLGKTRFFNPSKAGVGRHQITYKYPLQGSLFSPPPIEVHVQTPPALELQQEVCRKQLAQLILGSGSTTDMLLEVHGGALMTGQNPDEFYIRWDGESAMNDQYDLQLGRITLTPSPVLDVQGYPRTEYLIDISRTPVPDAPKISLINRDLLVCSYRGASHYIWYRNGMAMDTTATAYFSLAGTRLQAGDRLWVEVAYELGAFPCLTPSDVYVFQDAKLQDAAGFSLHAFPNPSPDVLNVHLVSPEDALVQVELLDALGRVRMLERFTAKEGETHSLSWHCGQLEHGLYFLRVLGNNHHQVIRVFIGK